MSIIFADGFDTYHRVLDCASRWSSNVPLDQNSTSYFELVTGRRAGSKAIIPSLLGSNSGAATGASFYTTITPSTEAVVALAIKPDYNAVGTGAASAAYHPLVTFASTTTMLLRVARHAQTGAINVFLGGSSTSFHTTDYTGASTLTNSLNGLTTATAALAQNDWNHIQVAYKVADAGGTISVRLNGMEIWSFSGDTKPGAGTTFDTISFYGGNPNNANSSGSHAGAGVYTALDDIVIATGTAPIGDAGVVALAANGDGTSTDWTATGTALGASVVSNAVITFGSAWNGTNPAALYDGFASQRAPRAAGYPTGASTSQANFDNNLWIKFDFGVITEIGGWRWCQDSGTYALTGPNQKLQGSNDNSTWTDLDTQAIASNVGYDSGTRVITPASYRYFRFKYGATSGGAGIASSGVNEIELFPTLLTADWRQFTEVPSNTASYLEASATNDTQLANYTDFGVSTGTVLAVQQRIVAGADSGSATLIPVARVGGTNYDGASLTVSGTGTARTIVWDNNPQTTTAWTRGQVNSAQFGAKMG